MSVTSEYLKRIRPNGPWFLQALPPEGGPGPFILAKTLGEAIEFRNTWDGRYNLYCRPNVTLPHKPGGQGPDGPGGRNSVASVKFVMADVDPYKPGAEGMDEAMQRLRGYEHSPTFTVMTGGGLQPYWELDHPTTYDAACGINQFFIEHLGADKSTYTPERHMRLPGTTNLPNAKKREMGRVPVEATWADVGEGQVYEDFEFPSRPIPAKVESDYRLEGVVSTPDLSALNISESLRFLIEHGHDEQDTQDGDNSGYMFKAVCDLIRERVPDEVIAGIMLDQQYPISAHAYKNGEQSAERAVERAIKHAHEDPDVQPRSTAAEDFDTLDDGSTDAAIEGMQAKATETKEKKRSEFQERVSRFTPHEVADGLKQPRPKWLAKGWMLEGSLNALVGGEKTFKTFTALDYSSRIALGLDWHGIPMTQGKVLYIIGEGNEREFVDRILAWCLKYGYEPEALRGKLTYIPLRVGLDNAEDMAAFMVAAATEGGYALVVIDTLARNMDGAENDTRDMNLFVRGADIIREKFGCAVMVLHHTGKDPTKVYRGNSALVGAVDSMWVTLREGDSDDLVLELYRSRSSKQGVKRIFKAVTIQTVEMGPEDEPSETLVMTYVREGHSEDGKPKPTAPKTVWERLLVAIAEMPGQAVASQVALVEELGLNKGAVSKSITALRDKEFITGTGPLNLTDAGITYAVELGASVPRRTPAQDFDGA